MDERTRKSSQKLVRNAEGFFQIQDSTSQNEHTNSHLSSLQVNGSISSRGASLSGGRKQRTASIDEMNNIGSLNRLDASKNSNSSFHLPANVDESPKITLRTKIPNSAIPVNSAKKLENLHKKKFNNQQPVSNKTQRQNTDTGMDYESMLKFLDDDMSNKKIITQELGHTLHTKQTSMTDRDVPLLSRNSTRQLSNVSIHSSNKQSSSKSIDFHSMDFFDSLASEIDMLAGSVHSDKNTDGRSRNQSTISTAESNNRSKLDFASDNGSTHSLTASVRRNRLYTDNTTSIAHEFQATQISSNLITPPLQRSQIPKSPELSVRTDNDTAPPKIISDRKPSIEALQLSQTAKDIPVKYNNKSSEVSTRQGSMHERLINNQPSQELDVSANTPIFPPLSSRKDVPPESPLPIDESIIVPDFVSALITTIKNDKSTTFQERDFLTIDGYLDWKENIKKPFQIVLCELLNHKFLIAKPAKEKEEKNVSETIVNLLFKIVSASNLLSKEGRVRDAVASIEFGNLNEIEDGKHKKDREIFNTEMIQSNNPVWNQHIEIKAKNLTDSILVNVNCTRKEEFLGYAKLNIGELISACARSGFVKRNVPLQGRDGKRDKFAGGEITIEASLGGKESPKKNSNDPIAYISGQLISCKVQFKSLYEILLRNCLKLDMNASAKEINDKTTELLSPESKALLRLFSRQWAISEAYQIIAYLNILFLKYQSYEVPTNSIMSALEAVHNMKRKSGWVTGYERPSLIELLEKMYNHYSKQITKYRDFFPKNSPKGALEKTIFMFRVVYKNPIYREIHPDLPESFSNELKRVMTAACVVRFETLMEFNAPLDDNQLDCVVESVKKLVDALTLDLDMDEKEFKIAKLTAEIYLKLLANTVETYVEILNSIDAVRYAALIFDLYKTLKAFDLKCGSLVQNIKQNTIGGEFDVNKWFGPFMNHWLDNLSTKTQQWVINSLKADTFEAINAESNELEQDGSTHSSSIKDLFQAVYAELDFLIDLEWTNVVQRAHFFQKFAKTVYISIEQYCDAISVGEIKAEATGSWVASLRGGATKSSDVTAVSCTKLCNMEFAVTSLESLYKTMNVATLVMSQKDFKATIKAPLKQGVSSMNSENDNEENVSGSLKIHIAFAEHVKGCNKNGLSNPYVIVRIPEGTVQATSEEDENVLSALPFLSKTAAAPKAKILNGRDCEIIRSHVVYDNLYPSWEESFECILPPVTKLEVQLFSKNLISSDELLGNAEIDLRNGTRLRKKLSDHQTYDVFIELDPQGRLLLRMTLEGEDENIDFWFRKTREKLARMRDDIGRSLVTRISPFTRDFIQKSIRENEATQLRGFFGSITGVVQTTNDNTAGVSIDKEYTESEVDIALEPLTDFLHKNLSTLFSNLPTKLSQEVIRKKWDDIVLAVETILVPNIYGQIEKDRKHTLKVLLDFFHANGNGLAIRTMQTRRYGDINSLMTMYHHSIVILKSEYESSMRDGREKVLVLRLVRLKYDKTEELSSEERELGKKWIDQQLLVLKERRYNKT